MALNVTNDPKTQIAQNRTDRFAQLANIRNQHLATSETNKNETLGNQYPKINLPTNNKTDFNGQTVMHNKQVMNSDINPVEQHYLQVEKYLQIQPIVDYYPRGIAEAQYIMQNSTNYLIYYDPDIDGAVSGDLVRRFMDYHHLPYFKYINQNRAHGYKLNDTQLQQLKESKTTIILVDAGMTKKEIEHIISFGVSIINIDHHHINETEFVALQDPTTGASGVIINNQYPHEPEEMQYLSGAGVVYYVLKALSPETMKEDEEALVGLSLLSDIRPLENPYARAFLHQTYTVDSELTRYLINLVKPEKDFGFGQPTLDRNFIDYTFSPKINSLFRTNNGELAMKIFSQEFPLEERDFLNTCREAQNQVCDIIIENLQGTELSNIIYKSVPHNLRILPNQEITNFIGLAASQVKGEYKTTILFVHDPQTGAIMRGSLRGLCDDVDYLGIVRRHGFRAEGHKNAFGIISVDPSKLDIEALNHEIAVAEHGYAERKYAGRIEEVNDLDFYLSSNKSMLSDFNNYVRDPQRRFLKYTGNDIGATVKGKAIIFTLNGVEVLCFEEGLHPHKDLILPVRERGNYIQFYLKPY